MQIKPLCLSSGVIHISIAGTFLTKINSALHHLESYRSSSNFNLTLVARKMYVRQLTQDQIRKILPKWDSNVSPLTQDHKVYSHSSPGE